MQRATSAPPVESALESERLEEREQAQVDPAQAAQPIEEDPNNHQVIEPYVSPRDPIMRIGRDEAHGGDTQRLDELLAQDAAAREVDTSASGAPKSEKLGTPYGQSMQFAPLDEFEQGPPHSEPLSTSHNAGVLAPPIEEKAPQNGNNGNGAVPTQRKPPPIMPPPIPTRDQTPITPTPRREEPHVGAPAVVYVPTPHTVIVQTPPPPQAPARVACSKCGGEFAPQVLTKGVCPTCRERQSRAAAPPPSNVTPFKRPGPVQAPPPPPKSATAKVPPPPPKPQGVNNKPPQDGAPHDPHEDYAVIDKPDAPRKKPRIMLVGNPIGRGIGSTNEFVWYTLLYKAQHGSFPVGIPRRMWDEYNNHPKTPFAKAQVKGEFSAPQEFIHGNASALKSSGKWPKRTTHKTAQTSGGQRHRA